MTASSLLCAAGTMALAGCISAPQHPVAARAVSEPNPAVVSVSDEDIKLTGHTSAAAALRELVPSVR